MTQRIEPFISWIWRLHLDLFKKYDAKNWTIFENSFDMTQRFELILLIWLKELNSFLTRLEGLSSFFFFNTTQRIEHFWIRLKELNTLLIWLKELNSIRKRLKELNLLKKNYDSKCCFCEKNDSKNWTLSFLVTTQRIELFSDMTQRIEPIFNTTRSIEFFKQKLWLKEFFFLKKKTWLKELNLFFSGKKWNFSERL